MPKKQLKQLVPQDGFVMVQKCDTLKKCHSFTFFVLHFGHCDLNSGLKEKLRTILELTDYPIITSVAIDVFVRLRHT